MNNCNKTAALLLLVTMLSACGTLQTKKEEEPQQPTAEQLKKQAEEQARLKQEYDQPLTTMRQGNYPLAIKEFTAFADKHPDLAGPYVNLGILYDKMNRLNEAEKALSKAVELSPNNALAQNRLGMVYRQLGRFDDAEIAYHHAISADENYADPYLNLGILYDLYLFDSEKALNYYNRYQKMTGGDDAQVSMWITELEQRIKRADRAANKK